MNIQKNPLPIPTIDCQVHVYARNTPEQPWIGGLHGPAEVTGDEMVKAMDAVGVHGALLASPGSLYGEDASYALAEYTRNPGRFGLIKTFNPESAGVGERVAEWAAQPGVVGARVILWGDTPPDVDHPGIDEILAAASRHSLPINILAYNKLPYVGEIAKRHPNTQIVIDHVGLFQPDSPPAPENPFSDLSSVLAVAEHDNVAIKISGACTLSHESFPYNDIWEPLSRIFEAFGLERCLWGTDWTRALDFLTYEQGVAAFRDTDRLTDSDRAILMGGSLARIYGWSPTIA